MHLPSQNIEAIESWRWSEVSLNTCICAEPAENNKQLSKRQLKRQKREREEKVRKAELANLEGKIQNSPADFERELMGSPNSSYLWIKYMAFQISLGEIEKARAVAEQALQRIHYRWIYCQLMGTPRDPNA